MGRGRRAVLVLYSAEPYPEPSMGRGQCAVLTLSSAEPCPELCPKIRKTTN